MVLFSAMTWTRLSGCRCNVSTGPVRGHAGTVASGAVRVGDEMVMLPGGRTARVERVVVGDEDPGDAGEAIILLLDREIHVSR